MCAESINRHEAKSGYKLPIDWVQIPRNMEFFIRGKNSLTQKMRNAMSQSACKGLVFKFQLNSITTDTSREQLTYEFYNSLDFVFIDLHQEEVINNIKLSLKQEEMLSKNLDEQLQDILMLQK